MKEPCLLVGLFLFLRTRQCRVRGYFCFCVVNQRVVGHQASPHGSAKPYWLCY